MNWFRASIGRIAWSIENLQWHRNPKLQFPAWFWTVYFRIWHVAYRVRYWAYIGHPYWKHPIRKKTI